MNIFTYYWNRSGSRRFLPIKSRISIIIFIIINILLIGRLFVSILMYNNVDVSKGTLNRYLFEFYRHISYYDYTILGNYIEFQEFFRGINNLDIEEDIKILRELQN